jgi:homoserine kinase
MIDHMELDALSMDSQECVFLVAFTEEDEGFAMTAMGDATDPEQREKIILGLRQIADEIEAGGASYGTAH